MVSWITPFTKQTWTATAVLLNMIVLGVLLSYTACLLPALQEPHSPITVDIHTASWLASSCGLAGILGYQISSALMDLHGRKITQILVVLPGIAGWLAIYWAQNVTTLMVGRILGGIAASASTVSGTIMIGEYTDPKYRGVFLNLKTASVNLGSLLGHMLGHFLSWRNVALFSVFPYIISLLITLTLPESPPWLASKGKFNECKRAFCWLRGNNEESNRELEKLLNVHRKLISIPKINKSIAANFRRSLTKFTKKDFLKPLFIMIISSVILEASGRHVFPAYALQIVEEITGSKTESFYYTLFIDIIITTSALCSSILVKVMRRRTLLFSTGLSAFAVLIVACIYLTLIDTNIIPAGPPWLAIGIFIVYFVLANLGCTSMPFTLMGEIFPLPHREVGSAIVGIWMSLNIMIALQITPYILMVIKVYGTFFIFGITMAVMLIILYFVLPETKDKTLQEIEDYFNNGKYKDDEDDDETVKIMN